ncbi:hypothetical protein GCM10027298_15560 [Epidermidibacterium keratini]
MHNKHLARGAKQRTAGDRYAISRPPVHLRHREGALHSLIAACGSPVISHRAPLELCDPAIFTAEEPARNPSSFLEM